MTNELIQINNRLAKRIQEELGQNVYLCYQCVKCSSGCPMGEFFDWQPNQIMRMVQLGQEEIALQAQTPWLCAACQTCTTRCPQGLDINGIMEYLTRESIRQGIKPQIPAINNFNRAMIREIRIWGRFYEPGLMVELMLKNPKVLLGDIPLYIKMLAKQKVGFFPELAKPPKKVKQSSQPASTIAYYPGCSLHGSAKQYSHSALAVCEALGITLEEPKDWVCCGSSAAHKADPEYAFHLPLRNLALIEQMGFEEVTMPCAACFNRHQAARYEINHHEQRKKEAEAFLEYPYQDSVRVTTLTEAILHHAGVDKIASITKKPLNQLKVVSYYGCLLTRPPEVTGAAHPENPVDMDALLSAAGAQVVDWSYKTTCCGAAHSLTRPDVVIKLSGRLIDEAVRAGAEAIVVACPLCHMNLDARQFQMQIKKQIPVLYFTQLLALAFGLPAKTVGLEKNLTNPYPLLRTKGLIN